MTKAKGKASTSASEYQNCNCFTEKDGYQLKEIYISFKKLIEEIHELKIQLAIS